MFEVSIERTFSSAHFLRNYKGADEKLHGHNYRVEITVGGDQLDETGMLVDFLDLQAATDKVVAYLDHNHINELAPFDVTNPSAENLAKYFCEEVGREMRFPPPVRITQVRIWETDTSAAVYRP